MIRDPLRPLIVALVLLAGACDEPPPDLRVGEVSFPRGTLLGFTPGDEALLGAITALALAVARDEIPELGRPLLERRRREALVEGLADEITVRGAGADEEALRTHYLTNPEHELTVRHLVFLAEEPTSDARREEARRKARAALHRVRAGEPFADLARELSEEPGADRSGGLLRPGREGSWVPEFWRAASALEEGESSGVVETRYGFHVLRLEDRRTVPFQDARARVVAEVAALVGDRTAWEAWADSVVAAELTVLESAADAWREGTASDSLALARWSGDSLTAVELDRYRTSLAETRRGGGDPGTPPGTVREAARLHFLAHRARDFGVAVPKAREDAIRRSWTERVTRWAAFLGLLEPAGDAEDIGARALRALDTTGQNARIAREEIRERRFLLLSAYPVEGLDETAPAGGA